MFNEDADIFDDSDDYGGPASDTETEPSDTNAPDLPAPPDATEENDENMPAETADKVRQALQVVEAVGLDLPSFLDALSWGTRQC